MTDQANVPELRLDDGLPGPAVAGDGPQAPQDRPAPAAPGDAKAPPAPPPAHDAPDALFQGVPRGPVPPVQRAPAPQPAPAPRPAPQPTPPKVRRVGTFTMGLALVITGVACMLSLLRPSTDLALLLRLSPLLLVALGIEVLAASFSKNTRLKYDLLSVFMCLILMGVGFAGTLAAKVFEYYDPASFTAMQKLEEQLDDQIYEKLSGMEQVADASSSINREWDQGRVNTLADRGANDARISVVLQGDFADKAAFLAAAQPVVDAILQTGVNRPAISFYMRETDAHTPVYELSLYSRYQQSRPLTELENEVSMRRWYEDAGQYMYETDHQDWAAQEEEMRAEEAAIQAEQDAIDEQAA